MGLWRINLVSRWCFPGIHIWRKRKYALQSLVSCESKNNWFSYVAVSLKNTCTSSVVCSLSSDSIQLFHLIFSSCPLPFCRKGGRSLKSHVLALCRNHCSHYPCQRQSQNTYYRNYVIQQTGCRDPWIN